MEVKFKPKLKETRWTHSMETEILEIWEKEKIYEFKLDNRPVFSIDTPPPYASGKWHIGAAVHYVQIDMIARYYRLLGFNVLFPMGIDRNGLPVEIEVEKRFGVRASETNREEFIEICRRFLDEVEKDLLRLTRVLGISANYIEPYRTDSPEYRALTQATFIELWKRGLIYEDYRPTNWCPVCKTTIADAEIEYVKRKSKLYYIIFSLDNRDKITIATTRPELIGACIAILYHPDDKRYSNLKNREAIVPIYGYRVPIIENNAVDIEFGTGLMMLCSYGDYTDIRLIRELNLKPRVIINEDGRMNEKAGILRDLTVEEARKKIIEELRKRGLIVKVEEIDQNVPTCWRSHNPIEFIHMREFYLKQIEFKEKLTSLIKEIKFYPEESINVLINWINSVTVDWPISRRRYYGTEIPIWYCKSCGTAYVPEPGRYYIPWKEKPPFEKCVKCGCREFIGETRTFDTWFDSSVSALFISGFKRNEKLFTKAFPVSLRPQGIDIVRTWLYYTLLRVLQLTGKPAFKAVRISGMGLDEKGEAMHKSKGNIVDPDEVIKEFCVEAIRFWGASEAKLGSNYRYSKKRIQGANKFITKLWNVARFISSFPIINHIEKVTPSDELILSVLNKIIEEVKKGYDDLDFYQPANIIRNFLWNVFAPHYIEMVKSRAYNFENEFTQEEQKAAWYTLHTVLRKILIMLHPINPFITDYIWRKVYDSRGIIAEKFPKKIDWCRMDPSLIEKIMKFNSVIWQYKKKQGMSLKDQLHLVLAPKEIEPFAKDLKKMHRIKELVFDQKLREKEKMIDVGEGVFVKR